MFWKIANVARVLLISCCNFSYIKKIFYSPEKNKTVYFRDKSGRIAVYHGVNVSNFSKYSPGLLPWQTKEDFARLKDWGFNLVRYLIFWQGVEPVKGTYDAQYIANTLERLKWLQELGINVIIDVHQDLYGPKYTGTGFPDWTANDGGIPFNHQEPWNMNYFEPALIASFNNFWKSDELKTSYINMLEYVLKNIDSMDNVIGIDVINEPFFGTTSNFEAKVLTDFYDKIQTMMLNKFNCEMCFEPQIYTSGGIPTALKFVPKRDCTYAPHYYDPFCHEGSAYGSLNSDLLKRSIEIKEREAQEFLAPLLIGEFGVSSKIKNYLQYMQDFIDATNKNLTSWTTYTYDKISVDEFGIINDDGTETEKMKILVEIYPQKIAGNNPIVEYGQDYFLLKYEADNSLGVTEIFIPKKTNLCFNGFFVACDNNFVYNYKNSDSKNQSIKITWNSDAILQTT